MKIKHYAIFGKRLSGILEKSGDGGGKISKTNWDLLRTDDVSSPFAIENTTELWVNNNLKAKDYETIAKVVTDEIKTSYADWQSVVSCGIGKGCFEWWMKKHMPQLKVDCTDYTEKSLAKLNKVWLDSDDIYMFDMLEGNWNQLIKYDAIVLYRLAEEFGSEKWNKMFRNMYESGIRNIFFIPAHLYSIREMIHTRIRHLRAFISLKKLTDCGWLYSESSIVEFWKDYYTIQKAIPCCGTKVYLLTRK